MTYIKKRKNLIFIIPNVCEMNFGQALQNLTRIFSDITNVIDLHYQEFLDNTEKSLDLVRIYYEDVIGTFVSPITFSDFQLNILKTFLVILAINLIFIKFYWNKYGDIITDRFIRPSMKFFIFLCCFFFLHNE